MLMLTLISINVMLMQRIFYQPRCTATNNSFLNFTEIIIIRAAVEVPQHLYFTALSVQFK